VTVCRLSLQNTGVVVLEYDWHITMIDRQTATDMLAGVPSVAARQSVSPRPGTGSTAAGTTSSPLSSLTPTTPAIIETTSPTLQADDVPQVASPAVASNVIPPVTSHTGTDADDAAYVPFSVTPASGEIAAGAAAEILVKFSPLDVSEYFACLTARY